MIALIHQNQINWQQNEFSLDNDKDILGSVYHTIGLLYKF